MHGVTYNHLYWNFPYGNGYYSYVDAATAACDATFDIDRIGDGNSSHPPSAAIDLNAGAVALHDAGPPCCAPAPSTATPFGT